MNKQKKGKVKTTLRSGDCRERRIQVKERRVKGRKIIKRIKKGGPVTPKKNNQRERSRC